MTENIAELSKTNKPELAQQTREVVPAIDIYENEHELLILADLPRVTPNNLSVEVDHPELKIQGRVTGENHKGDLLYARTFRLDSSLDVTKVEAKISDGVLSVHLPKSEPYRVRKIEVTGA